MPYLLKKGLAVNKPGWVGLAAIIIGASPPMVLLPYAGLIFALAAHDASLYTALIPRYVGVLAAVVLREAFTVAKRIGLVLVGTDSELPDSRVPTDQQKPMACRHFGCATEPDGTSAQGY
jgi:hypothetical protein